jgi:hypothetical protein
MTAGAVKSAPLSAEVTIPLPPPEKAPGFRDAVGSMSSMRAREVADGWLAIAPAEGAGAVYPYFTLERLADGATAISDETWAPLLANPRAQPDADFAPAIGKGGEPEPQWRERLLKWADDIYDSERPEAGLAYISAKLGGLELERVPEFLTAHSRELLRPYPDGSLWFLRTDHLLVKRMTLIRALLAIALMPDVLDENVPAEHNLPQLRTLQEHTVTRGVQFGKLIDPLLLTFSPATLGFVFDWMPHAVVFLSGIPGSMVRKYPATPWAVYEPNLQGAGRLDWKDMDFVEDLAAGQIETLLQWWVKRLNVVYSYLADPTRFGDDLARHSAPRQTAWFLTFERMLADFLLVQTGFQGSELARQQAAFDLLDKAEALLGFGKDGSGKGFERLLRRRSMVERLDHVWSRLPLQLQPRFRAHTRRLYDEIYEHARKHAYVHRLTSAGVKVSGDDGKLAGLSLESYVPQLVRAIRNSAHGFIEVMTSEQRQMRRDRALLATHDGKLPPQLGDLATLLAFAIIADFEGFTEGTWLPQV